MTITFRPAVRENVGLIIGLAGSSGSGKTYTAMRLAAGISGSKPFAVIDTEAGRAKHYADQFKFDHAELHPPFRPAAYAEAVMAADAAGYPVIVVDSVSHVWAGDGGVLDWQEEELTRMAGDDWKKREEWDRNGYWWFKFGDTAFRIPKPFEIGAMATLAERSWELAFDEEMTGKRFRKQVQTLLADNLSMNPIPQMIKPVIDVYANKDSFTGRPIETMDMERLRADYRFSVHAVGLSLVGMVVAVFGVAWMADTVFDAITIPQVAPGAEILVHEGTPASVVLLTRWDVAPVDVLVIGLVVVAHQAAVAGCDAPSALLVLELVSR